MKRSALAFAFAASTILFASCGTDTSLSTVTYEGGTFTMQVPKAWIDTEKASLPTPKDGEIALALTSADISSGYANNMNVLRGKVAGTTSSLKYSISNYALTTKEYRDFVKLNESRIAFADADESNLYTFEARYNVNTPKKRFLQTAKLCKDQIHLITIGLDSGAASTAKYEDLIKTFACK